MSPRPPLHSLFPPLVLLLLLSGCNSQADPSANAAPPRPVLAAKVEAAASQQNAYTGVVAARTESDLGFRVSGKVIERKVDPGQHVSRGDTLLVLDIGDFELALRSAKNRVNAAQAQLRQRRDDANRYQRLASTGAVSRQIFEQSATNLRVAEAELAAAQSDASQIENRRTYSVLRADGDGVITDVRVERGQVVAEGQIVARLAHDGAREAVINLPENQRDRASQKPWPYPSVHRTKPSTRPCVNCPPAPIPSPAPIARAMCCTVRVSVSPSAPPSPCACKATANRHRPACRSAPCRMPAAAPGCG